MPNTEEQIKALENNKLKPEPPCPKGGTHDYIDDGAGWDWDAYKCKKCGHRYKTFDDEMK